MKQMDRPKNRSDIEVRFACIPQVYCALQTSTAGIAERWTVQPDIAVGVGTLGHALGYLSDGRLTRAEVNPIFAESVKAVLESYPQVEIRVEGWNGTIHN